MRTDENRARYDRSQLCDPVIGLTRKGQFVAPLILPAKRGGNKRTVDVRAVKRPV